ncbi:hypothetical protein BKA67DRAFT_537260 [Truncatella angustata]|uniref:Uncharacterized protein n=1 Tax=Truncatella angustata TaxID=152316 RepID=A0A9P8UK80_9PEZI|nr:uncharacterized protein BKA67DRAFT_537260 [Truncatella angustata]KAH6653631.1 hypothetical protein BKA67DRAFT_537260 [Truncatella angustata]
MNGQPNTSGATSLPRPRKRRYSSTSPKASLPVGTAASNVSHNSNRSNTGESSDDVIQQRVEVLDAHIQEAEQLNALLKSLVDVYRRLVDENRSKTPILDEMLRLNELVLELIDKISQLAKKLADLEYLYVMDL